MFIQIRKYKESDWAKINEIFNKGKYDELNGSVKPQNILSLNNDEVLFKSFNESVIIVG